MKFIIALSFLALTACTDRVRSKIMKIGSDAEIKCYSGGQLVYDGKSSGMVGQEESGAGFSWMDKKTGLSVSSNADCVILN